VASRKSWRPSVPNGTTRSRQPPEIPTTGSGQSPFGSSLAQFHYRQKLELFAARPRGREPGGARLGTDRSGGFLANHPGDVNAYRALLHELAARDTNVAVRRLASSASRTAAPRARRFSSSTESRTTTERRRGAQDGEVGGAAAREEAAREVAARLPSHRVASSGMGAPLVGLIMGSRLGLGDDASPPRRRWTRSGSTTSSASSRRTARPICCSSTRLGRGARAACPDRGAGGAAHLPGMAAAKTALPVLGVPGRVEDAEGNGFAALDRADAGRRPGGDACDRARGGGQRGAARRRHPRPLRRRYSRAAGRLTAQHRRNPCSTSPIPRRDRVLPAGADSPRDTVLQGTSSARVGGEEALTSARRLPCDTVSRGVSGPR